MAENEDLVLTIQNTHIEQCGIPPNLKKEANKYMSYFENVYGEQFVFVYDRESKNGTVWVGDFSWELPQQVIEGTCEIILGPEVDAWLMLCWKTATILDSLKIGKE